MASWIEWGTFGAAVVGAAVGVFNAVVDYRRGRARLQITAELEPFAQGTLLLVVKVVNAGGLPVKVEKILLTGKAKGKIQVFELEQARSPCIVMPAEIPVGGAVRFAIGPEAMREPLELGLYTLVAVTVDGRRAKLIEHRLREFRMQLQAAAALCEAPVKRS